MKVINASPALIEYDTIDISDNKVLFGQAPGVAVATLVITCFMIAGFFAPGPFWIYWAVGFALAIAGVFMVPDTRKFYTSQQIAKAQVVQTERVSEKRAGGSLGGAAVGGVLFGGFGAVVGAVAGGNEVNNYKNALIVFDDGNWVVFGDDAEGVVSREQFKSLVKMAGPRWAM
jgi:hypothetical protein